MKKANSGKWIRAALIFALGVLMSSMAAFAAPASPYPEDIEQADGSVITVYICGDEFFNWNEDQDGYIIAYNEQNSNWHYAVLYGDNIVPGGEIVGSAIPWWLQNFAQGQRITTCDIMPLIENAPRSYGEYIAPEDDDEAMYESIRGITHTKNRQQLLVLLVEYNNRQFSTFYGADTTAYWSNHIFGTTGKTVNTYFKEVSGPFDLQFTKPAFNVADGTTRTTGLPADVTSVFIKDGVARVRLNKNHPNNPDSNTELAADIRRAFDATKQFVNFTGIPGFSGNSNVLCEDISVYSIVAGFEGSGTTSTPRVWAHVSWSNTTVNNRTRNISINFGSSSNGARGVLRTYGVNGELRNSSDAMTVGVTVHELGHILGLPDTYSYISGQGIGRFCLMASGSWGTDNTGDTRNGNTPTHFSAWAKGRLGFMSPTILRSNQSWRGHVNTHQSNYNVLQVTNTTLDPAQYFMVENRQRNGFDRGLPTAGSGILIYHIDERVISGYMSVSGQWTGRPNDNNFHKAVEVERFSISSSNPYYGNGGVFNATSTPNSNFHAAGHTRNPLPSAHVDCCPQNRPSGVSIRINSASSNAMEVIVGLPLGDINGDGVINASDITMLRAYIAAQDKTAFRNANPGFNLTNADVNGDGFINSADITLLRRWIAATNKSSVRLGPT
jgi:M6 family metalloprotease-like protein